MKILIADDDRTTRTLLARTAVSLGHHVVTAEDGDAALRVFDAEVRVVVTDWDMPGLDGPSLLAALDARGDRTRVYTVLMSARDDLGAQCETLASPPDEVIAKPFSQDHFRARLSQIEAVMAEGEGALLARRAARSTRGI